MNNKKQGFFWHVQNEVLLEWSHDIDERIAYVKSCKPNEEVETRLRLMHKVKGKLPKEVIEAGKALGEAGEAYDEAREEACGEAEKACRKAYYVEAEKAYDEVEKAYGEAIKRNLPALMELHSKECKDCPWDGKTIFSKA